MGSLRSSFPSNAPSDGIGGLRQTPDAASSAPTCYHREEASLKLRRAIKVKSQLRLRGSRLVPEGLSLLESESIAMASENDYVGRERKFREWCAVNQLPLHWDKPAEVVVRLLEYMDHCYMDLADPPESGTRLVAAVGHLHPLYYRQARGGLLTRVGKALRGWFRLLPSSTLAPWPWMALCGICNHMFRAGQQRMAVLTLLCADTYMRPGAFHDLTRENLIPPQPAMGKAFNFWSVLAHILEEGQQPNKVGVYSQSIILNSEDRQFLNLHVFKIHKSLMRGEKLCNFTMATWTNYWNRARSSLGLPAAPLYMMRHIGPSHDILHNVRTKVEAQERGGWAAASSMRRYEKAATTLAVLNKLPKRVQSHLRLCEKHIAAILRQDTPALRV